VRPAKRYVDNPNPLRDVMGSWVTRRIAVGVRCAGCGDVVAVEVVRVKRVENLPHPTTTIALARQALRRHGDAKGCIETGESDDTLPLVYRSAEQAHG
jgi:hypothetical protein